jgi:diguanylate cyclase (GGDEF)-like protein/PAS domain S-box-containing protein
MIPSTTPYFYDSIEDRLTARIVSTLIYISLATYLMAILTALISWDWELIIAALTACALQWIPYTLIRRGHLRSASMTVVLLALGTVTVIAMVGQGINDLAMITFPIIFIFAGLTLDRRSFRFSVGFALIGVCWLAIGDAFGWYTPAPLNFEYAVWVVMIMVIVLLLLAAIAVDLLAANMRRNLEQARTEIQQRWRAEEALMKSNDRFHLIMDATQDGLWDWIIDSNDSYFSPGYYRMLGYEIGEFPMSSAAWEELIHPDDREHTLRVNMDCIEGRTEQFEVEYRMKKKSGEWCWILARGKCVSRDKQGRAERLLGTHMDLTARKRAEELLRYQGTHDALTKIYNRSFFEEELARLERGREFPVSILMADLDGLKFTNDNKGHAAGDDLLRQAAELLKAVFRAEDVLARIGGDEFSALLPATDEAAAEHIAARIQQGLKNHNIENPNSPIHLSIGVATAESRGLFDAFKLADHRMYADKANRKLDGNTAAAR